MSLPIATWELGPFKGEGTVQDFHKALQWQADQFAEAFLKANTPSHEAPKKP